ncbi:MAG: RNA-binding protein [Synechococcaceae cyanobacterium SM2_3_60]|nr:RNA-binding protein [Synechococcaceae cyanobacterium SM2_3_60]
MSVRLYIGNLSEDVDQQALDAFFSEGGEAVAVKLIKDRKTDKCRGFGFLTVETDEQANAYIEKFNGQAFGEISLKVEVAQSRDSEGSDAPKPVAKKAAAGRRSGGNAERRPSSGTSRPEPATAAEPDPRWADQLQRIKEQLQAAQV